MIYVVLYTTDICKFTGNATGVLFSFLLAHVSSPSYTKKKSTTYVASHNVSD